MKIVVALAAHDVAKLALQHRVDVFDLVLGIDDVHPIGQGLQNGQQAFSVCCKLFSERLDALGLADVGPGQHYAVALACIVAKRQHALEHPAPIGQQGFALDAFLTSRAFAQVLQKGLLRAQSITDVTDRAADVAAPQRQKIVHTGAEAPQTQIAIKKDGADLGAVEQVVVVAVEGIELVVARFQLIVQRIQVFVDRLELLIGALQLFIGRREFLVAQVQALVAGLQLQHHFVQALARGVELGGQAFRPLFLDGWLQAEQGRHGRHSLGAQGMGVKISGQHRRLLAKQLVAAVHHGKRIRLKRPYIFAGTQQQQPLRLEGEVQLRQGLELRLGFQVNQQVAAQRQIDAGKGRIVQQVVAGKHQVPAQRGVGTHAPGRIALEIASAQAFGHCSEAFALIASTRGLRQGLGRKVGSKHFDIAVKPQPPSGLQRQHGHRIGFLPTGAARAPDAQIVPSVPPAQQVGQHLLLQLAKDLGVAKKLGHVDQQFAAQCLAFSGLLLQHLQVVFGPEYRQTGHALARAPGQGGGFVAGKVNAAASPQHFEHLAQLGQRLNHRFQPLVGIFGCKGLRVHADIMAGRRLAKNLECPGPDAILEPVLAHLARRRCLPAGSA